MGGAGQIAYRAVLWLAAVLATVPVALASDVPYVPTPENVVDAMLGIAQVGPRDYLIDLGSGDGRIVIAAAKKNGARGLGVEIDGALVNEARREARRQGVADRVEFHARNLFVTDIDRATVVTMYLYPRVMLELRPRVLTELKPGTRIVSHEFDFGTWQPDAKRVLAVPDKPYGEPKSEIYMWIVPADAAGRWRWRLNVDGADFDYDLTLAQTFQMLAGEPAVDGRAARFTGGRLRGETVEFGMIAPIGGRESQHEFTGRIDGDTIVGTAVVQGAAPARIEWRATRSARGKMNIGAGAPTPQPVVLIAEEQK